MIDWHPPHPKLATKILGDLYERGVIRQTYRGAPGMGITEFLIRDLLPEALKAGIPVVYCCLKDPADQPHQALLNSLQQATSTTHLNQHSLATALINLETSKTSDSVERAQKITVAKQLQVSESFAGWLNQLRDVPGLLIIEEIQHLATRAEFELFTFQLRTLIDQAGSKIRTLFTSSSQVELKQLFQDPKGPFYHFSLESDFPEFRAKELGP